MIYRWNIDKDIKISQKLLNNITPHTKLDLDISIVKELNNVEFYRFRRNFWEFITTLRKRQILVNYNDIRIQSIRYNILLLGPQIIQLNISSKCNYRCSFCCIHHSPFRSTESNTSSINFVPFENIKNFIDQAYMLGTETIYIGGDGEPLLHPEILKIILYVGRYNFKITVLTNAAKTDVLSRILKSPLPASNISFLVNLSAANSKKFALIYRKSPSLFNSLLENIKKINKHYPVALSYLIFNDTYEDIFEFIKLASSLNIRAIKFKFPTLYDLEQREKLLLNERQMYILLCKIGKIENFSKKYNINSELRKYVIDYYLQRANKIKILRCYNGWFFSRIKEDGNVYICCRENKSLGKINSSDFKEVFFSPSTASYFLEGKRGINVNSKNWRKCKYCTESTRNLSIDKLLE